MIPSHILKNYKRVDWLLVEIVVKALILAWSESEFVFVYRSTHLRPRYSKNSLSVNV